MKFTIPRRLTPLLSLVLTAGALSNGGAPEPAWSASATPTKPSPGITTLPTQTTTDSESRALEVLRKADAALREVQWLEYDFERVATYVGRGRIRGHVQVEPREHTRNESRYRIDATIEKHVPWIQGYPADVTVAQDGSAAWRVDRRKDTVERAAVKAQGWSPAAALAALALPVQLFRDDPFGVEIEQPVRHEYAGVGEVGNVVCDVVYLEFPQDSGYGEQYLYFGRDDHLMRQVLFANAVAGSMGPSIFEMAFTNLIWGTSNPPFDVVPEIPEGFRLVDRDLEDWSVGKPAPPFRLATLDGGVVSSEDLRGQAVVLEFWASWCPTCRVTLPLLEEVAKELEGRPVRVLAVQTWDDNDPRAFLQEMGLELEVLLGGETLANKLKVFATSHTVVLDTKGRIVLHELLFPLEERKDALLKAVDAALDQGATP